MVVVKNLTKEFVKQISKKEKITFKADDNISFEANDGEILGILGPNGAGKTTLLRMIAGIMTPTSGQVLVDGMNYGEHDLEIHKQLAFLSGNTKLYQDISCYELLKMCGEYYDIPPAEVEQRIEKITEELDMGGFLNQRIGSLSTGQTQRVGIARCILHDPKCYILDEATSGLDIVSSQTILEFIKGEKRKNKCVLYSTHYMEEAENICDRVVLIHKGKVITVDTPENITKKTNTTNLRDAFFALIGGNQNA